MDYVKAAIGTFFSRANPRGHVFGYDLGDSERAPCKWNNYPDRGEFGRARARNNLCPFVQTHPKKRTVSNGCA